MQAAAFTPCVKTITKSIDMRPGVQRSMDERGRVPVGVAEAGGTRTAGDFVMVCKAMDFTVNLCLCVF